MKILKKNWNGDERSCPIHEGISKKLHVGNGLRIWRSKYQISEFSDLLPLPAKARRFSTAQASYIRAEDYLKYQALKLLRPFSFILRVPLILVLCLFTKVTAQCAPRQYVEFNAGMARQTENLRPGGLWEIRSGAEISKHAAVSVGFLNDAEHSVNQSVDRLLPGDLSLRTVDLGAHLIKDVGRFTITASANGGYTFAEEHVNVKQITLGDLSTYSPNEELISTEETIRNAFSARLGGKLEYRVTDTVSVGLMAHYFFFETERERHVVTYDEDSPLPYNDRYYRYDTVNQIDLGYWVLMAGVKVRLF